MPRKPKPKPADPQPVKVETPVQPPPPSTAVRLRRRLFRPRLLVLLALAASSSVAVPAARRMLPDLVHHPEYQIPFTAIELSKLPHWVPPDFLDQVRVTAGLPEELRLLDPDIIAELAMAFEQHPWVAEVAEVRKSYPPRVQVTLSFRRPVAMVQMKDGLYPIDPQGVLLPPADFSQSDTRRYPVIQNVSAVPQGPAGTQWGDVSVAAAARLADALAEHWRDLHLVAILVPPRTKAEVELDDLQFELLTRGGSRIIWGRAPGSTHPGELTAEQKIGRMRKYLADFGSFDQPHGPYLIDITHWQEISRRPLVKSTTGTTPPWR